MNAVAPGGGGGPTIGAGNITLDMLRNARPGSLRTAATSLTNGSTNLDTNHGTFNGSVVSPLGSGYSWSGAGQPEAHGATSTNAGKITGVSQRLSPAATILNGLADFLDGAKTKVSAIDAKASDLKLTVSPKGDVTVDDVPGETPEENEQRSFKAGDVLAEAQGVLLAAEKADSTAAGDLNTLQSGDPTTPPPLEALHLDYWKKNFSDPGFWAVWTATALAAIPDALKSGALKFAAAASAQHALAKSLTNGIAANARQAAQRGYNTAFSMLAKTKGLGWATKGLPASTKFLSKVPYVGWAATGLGIGVDRANGESWGQAVTSNVLPTLAGTAATSATLSVLAGTAIAGGPATLVAVGVGVGVAYGVGYVVDHWDGITEGLGNAAEEVGDFFGF